MRLASGLGSKSMSIRAERLSSSSYSSLLYDFTQRDCTVFAGSISRSAGGHLPQASDGVFGNSLQMKVPDARTAIFIDFT